MSLVCPNMFPPLPCFTAASAYGGNSATTTNGDGTSAEATGSNTNIITTIQNQFFDSANDQDFDLLAEYLLDDGSLNATPTSEEQSTGYLDVGAVTTVAASNDTSSDPLLDVNALYQKAASEAQKQVQTSVTNLISQQLEGNNLLAMQQQQQQQNLQQQSPAPLLHPGATLVSPTTVFPQAKVTPQAVPVSKNATVVHHQHSNPQSNISVSSGYKRSIESASFTQISSNRPNQRVKSQAQIDKRRERNRILARRTRLRKKFFFESLQKEVMDLQRENYALKETVKKNFETDKAKDLLSECKVGDLQSILSSSDMCNENTDMEDVDLNFISSVKKSQQCFVITDPSLHDNPIVFASEDFFTLTGYTREEVLGRNCRFLQGMDTCPTKLEQIRKGIAAGEDVSVCIVNYTSDGTAFWNQLFIAALRDTQGNVVNFIGVLVKVNAPLPDDPEAGKVIQNETGQTEEVDDLLGAVSAVVTTNNYSS